MENSISTKQILNGKISCEEAGWMDLMPLVVFVLISGLRIDTTWEDGGRVAISQIRHSLWNTDARGVTVTSGLMLPLRP